MPKTESADTTEKPFNSVSAKENESVYSKEQTGSGLKGYGDDGKKISDENLTYKGMLININSATKEEFLLLDGIDNDLAGAIISYREENGGFIRPEDLLNVPGMTREILKNIYSYLLW